MTKPDGLDVFMSEWSFELKLSPLIIILTTIVQKKLNY